MQKRFSIGKNMARCRQAMLLLLFVSFLSACGQKGPLYLPTDAKPVKQTK